MEMDWERDSPGNPIGIGSDFELIIAVGLGMGNWE